jgi:hypothetical protein
MANCIARIEKYMQNAIDTVFALESKTRVLENGAKYIDVNFKEAGYVKVMSILMDGLSDYYRVNNGLGSANNGYSAYPTLDGYKVGDATASWEIFQLEYDRGKQFRIDNMDNEETAGLMIGNLLTEFLRTKCVPEVDAVRFAKIVSKTSATLGNYTSTATASLANGIIAEFNKAYEWLTDHEVPEEDQVIFVSPAVMTLIRNTTELYKKLSQEEYKGDVSFTIDTYEGRPIIVVPTNRFYTDINVGANGYLPKSGSKVINFIVCSKKCIIPIVKLEKSKIWTPDQVQDFDGYKVNFRLYHDVIIPKNKIAGVYVNVSTTDANTKTALLSVNVSVDSSTYTLEEYFTNPAGLLGRVVVSASAFTLGQAVTVNETTVKSLPVGGTFTKFSSETAEYYALLDNNDVAIAISGSVDLPTE